MAAVAARICALAKSATTALRDGARLKEPVVFEELVVRPKAPFNRQNAPHLNKHDLHLDRSRASGRISASDRLSGEVSYFYW